MKCLPKVTQLVRREGIRKGKVGSRAGGSSVGPGDRQSELMCI